jgi:hypothetical protein
MEEPKPTAPEKGAAREPRQGGPAASERERLDAELDEGLDESFPASDPPSVARRE